MSNTVEIRPLPLDKWHGKKGKESFGKPIKTRALVSAETFKYCTGLSEDDIEHLKSLGCNYDLSDQFVQGVPHPFWDEKISQIELLNYPSIYREASNIDYIKIKVMMASKEVANSIKEYDNGDWPEATHYIHSSQLEEKDLASKATRRLEASTLLGDMDKDRKQEIALLIDKKSYKNKSENALSIVMDTLVNTKTDEFIRLATKSKEEVTMEALVSEAIISGVLVKKGHTIKWGESTLGTTSSEVITYLNLPENSELKITILAEIQSK